MHIAREANSHIYTIHSYAPGVIEIRHPLPTITEGEREARREPLRSAFILTPKSLQRDWAIDDILQLNEQLLSPLLELECEMLLLGTGTRLIFPDQALLAALYAKGIGVEVMDSGAACRTYNILANEGRAIAAAMLMP